LSIRLDMLHRYSNLALLAIAMVSTSHANSVISDEDDLLVAYLYNIGKFVDWPSHTFNKQSHFNICLYGSVGSLVDSMGVLKGKKIQGLPLHTRIVPRGGKFNGCHILYVDQSERTYFIPILKTVRDDATLTLSNAEAFTRLGGMVSFIPERNQLRFDVNNRAVTAANLTVSSQVLRLARKVIK
jgi:hypothetical protein